MTAEYNTTSNTLAEALKLDMGAMIKAMAMIEHQPDTLKQVMMTTTAIKELIEPHCTYKADPKLMSSVMGIRLVTNDRLPKDWAMIEYQSGKLVMLNLVDGRTFDIPQIKRLEVMYV